MLSCLLASPPGVFDDPVVVAFLVGSIAHGFELRSLSRIGSVNGKLTENVGARRIVDVQVVGQSSSGGRESGSR